MPELKLKGLNVLIVFGWLKETREIGPALSCYCYRCQKKRTWELWKETEWVSFFAVKTIPFLRKLHVLCPACRDPIQLDATHAKLLDKQMLLPKLAEFLESHQLSQKTEVQRTFLLAQRQQVESRE